MAYQSRTANYRFCMFVKGALSIIEDDSAAESLSEGWSIAL